MGADVEELLAEIIRYHEAHGVLPTAAEIATIAGGDPNLASRLGELVGEHPEHDAQLRDLCCGVQHG